jgi:hypothetical protein
MGGKHILFMALRQLFLVLLTPLAVLPAFGARFSIKYRNRMRASLA